MTASSLPAALRVGAQGRYALEAATGLIIAHGSCISGAAAPPSAYVDETPSVSIC